MMLSKEFLKIAHKIAPRKDGLSVFEYIESDGTQLKVSNGAEFLICKQPMEEKGLFNFKQSEVLGKLSSPWGGKFEKAYEKELPETPHYDDLSFVALSDRQKKKLLEASGFVSRDETRFFMNGVYFSPEDKIVATDGRIMYVASGFEGLSSNVIVRMTPALQVILSEKCIVEMESRTFDDATYGTIFFKFEIGNIQYVYGNQIIDGKFPNWKKVIPETYAKRTGLPDRDAWKEIFKKARALKLYSVCFRKISDEQVEVFMESNNLEPIESLGILKWTLWCDATGRIELRLATKYFDKVLTIGGINEMAYSDFRNAIRFNADDGTFALVMPCTPRDEY